MLTCQSELEDYEKYIASRNANATYTGAEEYVVSEMFPVPYDLTDLIDSKFFWRFQFSQKRKNVFEDAPYSLRLADDKIETDQYESMESPFEKLDEVSSNEEKVRELISFIRKELKKSFSEKLANRLSFLYKVSQEESPGEEAISFESLRNFIFFLNTSTKLKYPDVVLSPLNNIRAQWRAASNRHFAAEFLPTGDVSFVIFSPDFKKTEKIIRLSGITSVESLIDTTAPHGVLHWASQ